MSLRNVACLTGCHHNYTNKETARSDLSVSHFTSTAVASCSRTQSSSATFAVCVSVYDELQLDIHCWYSEQSMISVAHSTRARGSITLRYSIIHIPVLCPQQNRRRSSYIGLYLGSYLLYRRCCWPTVILRRELSSSWSPIDDRSIGINRNDRITLFSSLVIYSINISYLLDSISAIAFL